MVTASASASSGENPSVNFEQAPTIESKTPEITVSAVEKNLADWLAKYNAATADMQQKLLSQPELAQLINQAEVAMKAMDYPTGDFNDSLVKLFDVLDNFTNRSLISKEITSSQAYSTVVKFYVTEKQVREMRAKNTDYVSEYPALLDMKKQIEENLPKNSQGEIAAEAKALFDKWIKNLTDIIAITQAIEERRQKINDSNPLGELQFLYEQYANGGTTTLMEFFVNSQKLDELIGQKAWEKLCNSNAASLNNLKFSGLYIKAIQWPLKYPLFLRELKYIAALPEENKLHKQYKELSTNLVEIGDKFNRAEASFSAMQKIGQIKLEKKSLFAGGKEKTLDETNQSLAEIQKQLRSYMNGELASQPEQISKLANRMAGYIAQMLHFFGEKKAIQSLGSNVSKAIENIDSLIAIMRAMIADNPAMDTSVIERRLNAALTTHDQWINSDEVKKLEPSTAEARQISQIRFYASKIKEFLVKNIGDKNTLLTRPTLEDVINSFEKYTASLAGLSLREFFKYFIPQADIDNDVLSQPLFNNILNQPVTISNLTAFKEMAEVVPAFKDVLKREMAVEVPAALKVTLPMLSNLDLQNLIIINNRFNALTNNDEGKIKDFIKLLESVADVRLDKNQIESVEKIIKGERNQVSRSRSNSRRASMSMPGAAGGAISTNLLTAYAAKEVFKNTWSEVAAEVNSILNPLGKEANNFAIHKHIADLFYAANIENVEHRASNIEQVQQAIIKAYPDNKQLQKHFANIANGLKMLANCEAKMTSDYLCSVKQQDFPELHEKNNFINKYFQHELTKDWNIIILKTQALLTIAAKNNKYTQVENIRSLLGLIEDFKTKGVAVGKINEQLAIIENKIKASEGKNSDDKPGAMQKEIIELANLLRLASTHYEALQANKQSHPAYNQFDTLGLLATHIANPIAFAVVANLKANVNPLMQPAELVKAAKEIQSIMNGVEGADEKLINLLKEVFPKITYEDLNNIMAEKHRQEMIQGVNFNRLLEISGEGHFSLQGITYGQLAEFLQESSVINFGGAITTQSVGNLDTQQKFEKAVERNIAVGNMKVATFKREMLANNILPTDVANKVISEAALKQLAELNPGLRVKGIDAAAISVFQGNPHLKIANIDIINNTNKFLENGNIRKTSEEGFKAAFAQCINSTGNPPITLTDAEYKKVRSQKLNLLLDEAQHNNMSAGNAKGTVDAMAMDSQVNNLVKELNKLNDIFLPKQSRDKNYFSQMLVNNSQAISKSFEGLKTLKESIELLAKLDKKDLEKVIIVGGGNKSAKDFVSEWKEKLKERSFKQKVVERIKEATHSRNLNLEALQKKLEENCLAQFAARVDYLAKQSNKLTEEAHKRLAEVKSNPDKLEKLFNKLNEVYQELQSLRIACGRVASAGTEPADVALFQQMQSLIVKAEKAAGIKVELEANVETKELSRIETFEITNLAKRLEYKHEMITRPALKVDDNHADQIINDVGGMEKIKAEAEQAKKDGIEPAKMDQHLANVTALRR